MNIIICDHSTEHRTYCESLLNALSNQHNIQITIKTYESGEQLLFEMEDLKQIDLIYLDHNLKKTKGMQIAHELRNRGVLSDIVFYTADREQVFHAFDVEALHYIVHGEFTEARFEQIFLKAKARAEKRNREILALYCAGEYRNIPIDEIRYFEVKDHLITVYYGDASFQFYSKLAKLTEMLFGKGFARVHRAFLVNERYIAKITMREVTLKDGQRLPAGRSYVSKLKLG